jgi:hypothetical protein
VEGGYGCHTRGGAGGRKRTSLTTGVLHVTVLGAAGATRFLGLLIKMTMMATRMTMIHVA